jgi:di/tricarboxylate transporter
MSFEFWFTLLLFIVLTIVLIKEIVKPEIAIFSTLILLVVGNVVTVKEAFSGFSNEGMLTIALLFVVAGSFQTTGVLDRFNKILYGNPSKSITKKLIRILSPLTVMSAFLNNTPLVAMAIPSLRSWSEKHNLSVSKFLIPVSYAAILGGMCTLIGTSTNLIVHGLLIENNIPGFSFFELSFVGIPAAIIGLIYIFFIGHKLLPERKPPLEQLGKSFREFVSELKVTEVYINIGKNIEEAGLRHLKGLYLFQIERNGKIMNPAKPDDRIQLGDRLFFTGIPKTILELQRTPGLQLINDSSFDLKNYDSDKIKTYEAVISFSSSFAGKRVKESNFRDKYDGVILAIHRNGERIRKKIGDVILRPGDTLLLLADKNFKKRWYYSTEFSLISNAEEIQSKPKWQANLSIIIFAAMLILAVFNILPLISAMGIAAVILVLSKSITGESVINAVDWKVLLIIASSFGIALAMENSGVGEFFAAGIINLFLPLGVMGVLTAIYIMTTIYTNFITNNTAAVLMFPIALSVATYLNVNVHPFAIAIALGASSSFATPISYQTNLMVYGPGGYKYRDFLRIGLPLQFIVGVISIVLIYLAYFS